jgi:hypothetical protein
MDELKAMLREVLENQHRDRRRVDEIEARTASNARALSDIEGSITAIARSLEQDDRLQERLERAEAREREELAKDVDDVKQRVEGIGAALRGLPEKTAREGLRAIEHKINEWRTAKYEAMQAGMLRDPTPPMGTQLPYREQTSKIAVAAPEPEDLSLTPAQQRGLVKVAKKVWLFGRWPALAAGAGGGAVALWQKLMHLFGH